MAHYAFLNDENVVIQVISGKDETELIDGLTPEEWYSNFTGYQCVRTSFNGKIRYNFAGLGYVYDPIDDAFIAPMPDCKHESLLLTDLKIWQCNECEEIVRETSPL